MWLRRLRQLPPTSVALVGGVVLLGALVVAALWWSNSRNSSVENDAAQASFEPHFHSGEGEKVHGRDKDDHSREAISHRSTAPNEDRGTRRGNERRTDEDSTQMQAPYEAGDNTDEEMDVEKREEHRRPEGLGPTRWMAPPEDVDVEELEEQLLEGEQRQARELAIRTDQKRSVRAVESPLEECFEELRLRRDDAGHRIALGWTVQTSGAVGTIESPQIIHHIGASDDSFDQCVIEAVDGLDFDAVTDGEEVEVEYGFFLE